MADARPSALSASDLQAHSGPVAHQSRQPGKNFAEIAARLGLNADRHRQEQQIRLTDATVQVVKRAADIEAETDFIGEHAEFCTYRIRHFPGHQRDRANKWQPDPNAADNNVDGVGQLFAE